MKKLLLFLALYVCIQHANAQVAYYDALKIRTNYVNVNGANFTFKGDPTSKSAIAHILKNYLDDANRMNADLNEDQVIKLYQTNAFIDVQAVGLLASSSLASTGIAAAFSSAANLDITNLADGLAKFLVERTKEELNAAFFENFKKKMASEEYKDAQILFPQTYATLNAIGNQIYNYEVYLGGLRESFASDLNGLLANLPKLVERHQAFFDNNPKLKAICLSAIDIGNGLINKQHPGQIIADFNVEMLNGQTNIKGPIQTLQLFSASLRSTGKDGYWINSDSLKLLLNDPISLKIYFGLLYQKAGAEKIVFNNGKTLQEALKIGLKVSNNIQNANQYLSSFIKQTEFLAQHIKNISVAEKEKLTFQDYYGFYNSALDVLGYAGAIKRFPGVDPTVINADFEEFIRIARIGGNIALDISRKNYGAAIINFYQIYDYAFADAANAKFKSFFLKYGTFVASVAEAETSDEVKKAIAATALPSGSSRIKRVTPFNVALNAYVGLFTGKEEISGLKNSNWLNSYGVAAPVGVSISRGHSILFFGGGEKRLLENKGGWSSSLFLSLVDLGAVAAYRFENDEAAEVPTIKLKHIFSPGIFLSTGIPKSPLSLNIGMQVGPTLRKVDNNGNTPSSDVGNKTYVRYSISLAVDIPLLNFYTKN